MLRDYDRRVMEIIHVDDFATDEMAAGERPVDSPASAGQQRMTRRKLNMKPSCARTD